MRTILVHDELKLGQRVYVKDLDVFGRVRGTLHIVVCESPMLGYVYHITEDSILYDDAIGDRDTENDERGNYGAQID